MDILFETMIATPLTFSLLIAGISMAIVGLFIGAVEATDAKDSFPKKAVIWFAMAALGLTMVIGGINMPKTRRVYALPEEGFCFADYENCYNLVEQKGKILVMDSKD